MRARLHEPQMAGAARRTGPRAAAALPVLAAAAIGWGGAVLALVWRLRLQAWEGRDTVPWTAPALALTGLLVGCWLGGRVPPDGLGRPARWTAQAGLLLCLGSLGAVTADLVVLPGPPAAGLLAWALAVPAGCWGAAAVRMLQSWGGPVRSPLMLAAALLGAGLAFLLGPVHLAVEGLTTGQRQAGAAGLVAAFLLLSIPPSWSRAQLQAPDPDAPRAGGAVGCGLLVALVWCWLLPRVDLLWGFSSGPLRMPVAALFTAAFGCAALTPLLRRMWGASAPGRSGLLAVGLLALGLHEHLAPAGPSAPVGGWRQAVVLALPAALVGALPGLVLARPRLGPATVRRIAVGLLVGFTLGHGALVEIVPRAWPGQAVQLVALAAPALAALLLVRATALAIPAAVVAVGWGLLGLGGQPSPWEGAPAEPEWAGPCRVVVRAGGSQVEYDRSRQELVLRAGRDTVDRWGPGARASLLAGNLPRLLRPEAGRVVVLGLGNGRVAAALARGGAVVCFEARAGAGDLVPALAADGPVPAPGSPVAWDVERSGLRAVLDDFETGSVDLLVTGAPVSTAEPWLSTLDFHRLARRVLGDGLLVRTAYVSRTPADLLETELTAASRAHPHLAVLLVRDAVVLLASGTPLPTGHAAWEGLFQTAPGPSHRELHRAGIASGDDLAQAVLFYVRAPLPGVCWRDDDLAAAVLLHELRARRDERAGWSVLSAALAASGGGTDTARQRLLLRTAEGEDLEELLVQWSRRRRQAPDSQIVYEDEVAARLRLDTATVTALAGPDVPGGGPLAAALSAKWRGRGCPEPVLQAALGLSDPRGTSLVEPEIAGRNAVALDPTFFDGAPARLRELAPPEPRRSPLEDLGVLPVGGSLARAATGSSAMAVALRARFRIECAHALVDAMAERSLSAGEQAALAQVTDPTSLRRAVRAAVGSGRLEEALAVWRADLSMPSELKTVLRGPVVLRQALASALAGRGDSRSIDALAALLTDAETEVRVAAGAALFRTVGERIPFDPQWPETRLQQAADRLKALHNRNP